MRHNAAAPSRLTCLVIASSLCALSSCSATEPPPDRTSTQDAAEADEGDLSDFERCGVSECGPAIRCLVGLSGNKLIRLAPLMCNENAAVDRPGHLLAPRACFGAARRAASPSASAGVEGGG
jgi:hypothetical protein